MTRTLGSTITNGIPDIDGTIVDGIESLRQRVVQRLGFGLREWILDTRLGTAPIPGEVNSEQIAAQIIGNAIREEGGDEIEGALEFLRLELDGATRRLTYSVSIPTIYGTMTVDGTLPTT